jgi:tetratricopeptide (TPR) repeat protein
MFRGLLLLTFLAVGCAGKYAIRSYPVGAKVYVRDVQTQEKKLLGISPLDIAEENKLGDVFFLIFEKQNYREKEVMLKVNPGESLLVSARLDPLNEAEIAANSSDQKDDENKLQPPKPEDKEKELDKKLKEMLADINELKLRVALLENTASFTKDALFSPRLAGGSPASDRDRSDRVVGFVFEAQQSIMKNSYPEALKKLDEALKLDEYSNQAWLLKGSAHYLLKDYSNAKLSWERTLKLDPHNKVAYQYLSEVYKRLGIEELPKNAAELRYPASNNEIERRSRANQ